MEPDALFAYGTLMFGDIFRRVTGSAAKMEDAELAAYARRRVRGHSFPGLVPHSGASVRGKLVHLPGRGLWPRLDDFETDFYERIAVTVTTDDGRRHAAATYVVTRANRVHLESGDWDPRRFEAQDIERYLGPV